jgi:hypothetical protein
MIIHLLILVCGIGVLIKAIWPGAIESLIGFLNCVSIPILLGTLLLWLNHGLSLETCRLALAATDRRWRWRSIALVLVVLGMLVLRTPQRLVLTIVQDELETLVASAPSREWQGEPLERQIGPYWIDEYAADPRGGVYFRTYSGRLGLLGMDTVSYGFAYRPNTEGCPFGHHSYRYHHLFGDWYAFSVVFEF